jgi:hypothetical protein
MGTLVVAAFTAQYGMHHLFSSGPTTFDGHHGEGGPQAGLGMLAAHVIVAISCAWWLRRGETALMRFLRLLAWSLRDLWGRLTVRLRIPPTPRPAPVAAAASGIHAPQVLAWAVCRRGPPCSRSAG